MCEREGRKERGRTGVERSGLRVLPVGGRVGANVEGCGGRGVHATGLPDVQMWGSGGGGGVQGFWLLRCCDYRPSGRGMGAVVVRWSLGGAVWVCWCSDEKQMYGRANRTKQLVKSER